MPNLIKFFVVSQAMELTQNEVLKAGIGALLDSVPGGQGISRADIDQEVYHTIVSMEDYLWKKGRAFSLLNKRYFLLSGNCMYYYTHKENVRPRGVIFLTGCIIERYSDVDMEIKVYLYAHSYHVTIFAYFIARKLFLARSSWKPFALTHY